MFICYNLIHLIIGEIYAQSVLYTSLPWTHDFSVMCFGLTILTLGISAGWYRKIYQGVLEFQAINQAITFWLISGLLIIVSIKTNHDVLYMVSSLIKGYAIGVLYALTISAIAEKYSKAMYSGAIVMSFGLGSLLASQLYSHIGYNVTTFIYSSILVWLILRDNDLFLNRITYTKGEFPKLLGVIFFLNISIGITLLSNLVELTKEYGVIDGVILVGLSGIANGLGRIIYPILADKIGKINCLIHILLLQSLSLAPIVPWESKVLIIISVYGGVFALMPSICKEYYSLDAYCSLLPLWGVAGLISPNILTIEMLPIVAFIIFVISLKVRK